MFKTKTKDRFFVIDKDNTGKIGYYFVGIVLKASIYGMLTK